MVNKKILQAQRKEITEFLLYEKIAKLIKDPHNKKIVEQMALQEKNHYKIWEDITKQTVEPSYWHVHFYYLVTKIFGLNFGLKFMERGEEKIVHLYEELKNDYPSLAKMLQEEQEHEQKLLNLINSKVLQNVSSVILGLNDALIELTGALAGFTLALAKTNIIAMVGLITGIAASISMASSSYLATKEDPSKNAISAGLTTGFSYIITVLILVGPYFLFTNPYFALITTLSFMILIILAFNLFTSVAQGVSFKKKFGEMAVISMGAAAINFGIGYIVKIYFGV